MPYATQRQKKKKEHFQVEEFYSNETRYGG